MHRAVLVALALVVVWASPSHAVERQRATAVRATGPIRVDGALDEPDWARAPVISDFRRIEHREGEAPSESTEVRVLFDATHLYVGARCWNRGPGAIRASLAPRDQILDLDYFGVLLDTYQDRHRAYGFGVNPYGVQVDGIFLVDDINVEWDGVWNAETTRDGAGWTAELAVPLRTLSFPERGSGAWGLLLRRQIAKNDEECTWPLIRADVAGDVMLQAADLTGLESLRGAGLFDVQPYGVMQGATRRSFDDAGHATRWEDERKHNLGVDARVPLTSTLVLNATVNPDFSQIEADALQIEVNQRDPLYYEEKRPFFLEGADIFDTAFALIYTRRLVDPAYGAKLAGRVGPARVGAIVVRDDGGGDLGGVGGGPVDGVSTRGWFEVGRTAWEIGENSSVGALVALHQSDRARSLAVPAFLEGQPLENGGSNGVFAVDADLRLSRRWFFHGQLAHSRTHADSIRLDVPPDSATALAPRRSTRASYDDVAYGAEFDYTDGIRELQLFHQYVGPDFRTESGFLPRVDFRRTRVNADFYVRPENAVIRSIQPIAQGYVMHDPDGRIQEWWWSPMVEWQFQKQTHSAIGFERKQERWQGRDYLESRYSFDVGNSQLRMLSLWFGAGIGDGIYYEGAFEPEGSYLGWLEQYEFSGTLRPSARLTLDLETARNRFSRDHGHGVVYDVWTTGVKTTFQFTRRLYARVFPQWDSAADHLDMDALLGYVIHPGSVVYLGYNGDGDRVARRNYATGHTVFCKVSYRFQR